MTTGRAFRTKQKGAPAANPMEGPMEEPEAGLLDYGIAAIPEDMPSPNAPIEERQAWFLEHAGAEFLSDEVLDELRERECALPGCTSRAARGRLFCGYHQKTALGEEGARELRALNREMERLAKITDRDERKVAMAKFRARTESGSFAILFSRRTQETMEQAGQEIVLDLELGALRMALSRAIQEIEDPKELSLAVARLSNAAVRATDMNYWMRKARKREERGK